jgi:branched-chain amino acid transport system substrate-binding protein
MRLKNRWVWAVPTIIVVVMGGVFFWWSINPQVSEEELLNGIAEEETLATLNTIRIGVMSHEWAIQQHRFLGELAREDINTYCNESGIDLRFEFVYTEARFNCDSGVRLAAWYKEDGVDLVVGPCMNINLHCSLPTYARNHSMVMLSPSVDSSYWDYAFNPEYPLFRLCPSDTTQAKPLVKTIRSLGITDVIVHLQEGAGRTRLHDIYDSFVEMFEDAGGTIDAKLTFTLNEEGPDQDFSNYLERLDSAVRRVVEEKGAEHTCILQLGGSIYLMLPQMEHFPGLHEVTWFGIDETASSQFILERAGEEAAKVKLLSPYVGHANNSLFQRLNEAYIGEFNWTLSYYQANLYDACWIMALSVIEAGTANATGIEEILPIVASQYDGATGRCLLDENRTRVASYNIWGYFEVDGEPRNLRCGFYNATTGEITWDEDVLGLGGNT